ncbi:hypothetical protein GCM10018785_23320 [Streptomyces longispororuber]|uniref:Uncharacterized protein n=1 Tax=Streptomyces longispororuber TaxID=68230 RepID=A0A918ZIB8_9ACTN|nr:hypothetical protein GCM10018785_23320 [Streptomyces longispororuber]
MTLPLLAGAELLVAAPQPVRSAWSRRCRAGTLSGPPSSSVVRPSTVVGTSVTGRARSWRNGG